MKHHLLSGMAAGLLLATASAASAQAVVKATQHQLASGSMVLTDQTTSLNGRIIIDQAGVNGSIDVLQDGGSGAEAEILQSANIVGASAEITQIDGYAVAEILQNAASTTPTGAVSATIRQQFGGGEFDDNTAFIGQFHGETGSAARIEQVGDTLSAIAYQINAAEGSFVEVRQFGGANTVYADQSQGKGEVTVLQGGVDQNVYGNTAYVRTVGDGNTASLVQVGDSAEAHITQNGEDNALLVGQLSDNRADVVQDGHDNLIQVSQTGNTVTADISQSGANNQLTLVQSQDGVFADLTQGGAGNQMTILQ